MTTDEDKYTQKKRNKKETKPKKMGKKSVKKIDDSPNHHISMTKENARNMKLCKEIHGLNQ